MSLTAWILAAIALALAWPVPVLLSRARWPSRSPAIAMILWQAVGLAGGLSMIGAMLTWGLSPLGSTLLEAARGLVGIVVNNAPMGGLHFWHLFALSAATLLGAHLVFTLLLTYLRIVRQRRRHRDLLTLLSSPSAEQPGTVLISHAAPVAYCLPGGARSVTVLSEGLVQLLSPEELRGVLTHEGTHLAQRHHLLLWVFAAWKSALPWLPTSKLAQQSVNELIEMLADDAALRVVDEATLVRSIALVSSGTAFDAAERPTEPESPAWEDAAAPVTESSQTTAARILRLLHPQPPLPLAQQMLILLAAGLLLLVPTAFLVLPSLLA
ncbi:M56 family metallopeptidase [Psychromicrobium xiongbiense]|uniref:M56 family metallopeptidase n=1 Tax=Psychromicrobium xiongbiense TaxID=3051184 RepID=UPI002555BD81|nr:M56 family metallopeptidase [Psychromicrobium sp. YIM S02556]